MGGREEGTKDVRDASRGTTNVSGKQRMQWRRRGRCTARTSRQRIKRNAIARRWESSSPKDPYQGRNIKCFTCDGLAVQHPFQGAPSAWFHGMGVPPKRTSIPMHAPQTAEVDGSLRGTRDLQPSSSSFRSSSDRTSARPRGRALVFFVPSFAFRVHRSCGSGLFFSLFLYSWYWHFSYRCLSRSHFHGR